MANREKGESSIVVGGKTYTLLLNSDAMVAMETAASNTKTAVDTVAALASLVERFAAGVTAVVAHPNGNVTAQQVSATVTRVATEYSAQAQRLAAHEKRMFFSEVMALAQSGSWTHQRILVWASLQRYHPDVTMTQAGDLMLASATEEIARTMTDLAASATPDPADVAELGISANPPAAQGARERARRTRRGTGARSTSTHAASV